MRRPRFVDDLHAKMVPREGLQDPVPVRRISVTDSHPDVFRRERADRLADVERDGFRARGDPRVDDLAVSDDRDAGLAAGSTPIRSSSQSDLPRRSWRAFAMDESMSSTGTTFRRWTRLASEGDVKIAPTASGTRRANDKLVNGRSRAFSAATRS